MAVTGSNPDRRGYIQVFSQTGVPQTAPIAVGSKRAESVIFEVDTNSSGEIAVAYNEITDASGPGSWQDSVISVERFSTGIRWHSTWKTIPMRLRGLTLC